MPTKHLLRTLMTAIAAVAFATGASAQMKGKKPETCVVVGAEVPKQKGKECPPDVLGALRTHVYQYEFPKVDKDGRLIRDPKTGKAVMEVRKKTYGLMADLLEAIGLKKAIDKGMVTVFAVPDSVLQPALKDLGALLKDEKQKRLVFSAIAKHVTDEPLMADWFRSKNGKIWTFAGDWKSDPAPLWFHALRDHTTIEINYIPLQERDILASNGVIHTVDSPLVPLPKLMKKGGKT